MLRILRLSDMVVMTKRALTPTDGSEKTKAAIVRLSPSIFVNAAPD